MIDPRLHSGLGGALDAAYTKWARETCLVETDRERETARLTFNEVAAARDACAAFLAARGFGAGDRAAILLSNQWKWHVAAAAVFHRGGVLVPLDPKLSPEEQRALLDHCGARLLFIEDHLMRALGKTSGAPLPFAVVVDAQGAPAANTIPWDEACGASPGAHGGASPAARNPPAPRSRTDAACIVYSSGTSGRPKGCILTHGNYLAQLASLLELHPFAPGVRYLSILPTNHAIDFMVGFLGPAICGATVVHLRTIRPELVREAFVRHRITHVALVPAIVKNLEEGLRRRIATLSPARRAAFRVARLLLASLSGGRPNPRLGRLLLRPIHDAFGGALQAIFVGGAPSDPETLRSLHALGIPVANGYGLTEAGTAVTLDRLDPPRPETVGTPLPGVKLRLVNTGEDDVGEILVRSETVMAGYLDDEELTREAIVDGWLHTGDLGTLEPSGHLRLLGRSKNMIVTSGGKNVYPEDVERAFEGLPAKEFVVVVAHALAPAGSLDERLLLVVHSGKEGAPPETLREAARAKNRALPVHRRVAGLVFASDEFPRTASLKVKRGELIERLRQGVDLARDVIALKGDA